MNDKQTKSKMMQEMSCDIPVLIYAALDIKITDKICDELIRKGWRKVGL